MTISPGMLFRKIVGVLFLIVAGAIVGGAVVVTGFDGSGLQAPSFMLAIAAVFSLIGVAFFGFRKWRPVLCWILAGAASCGLPPQIGRALGWEWVQISVVLVSLHKTSRA